MRNGQRALGALAVAVMTTMSSVSGGQTRRSINDSDPLKWVGTWSASQQVTEPRNMPPALGGNTLRQVVHVSLGGKRVRLRLSNEFGDGPVSLGGVRLGDRVLTFGGHRDVVIPAGRAVDSDPLSVNLAPLSDVAITMFVREVPAQLTGHPGSRTTSYIATGDQLSSAELTSAARVEHWYLISGIDVERPRGSAAVVLGNSIADGRGSGTDKQNRWPDNLARRLQEDARTADVAVLNAGIGGNCVLKVCIGPSARERLDRDVLTRTGVKWLIVSEGVNDVGGARTAEAAATIADSLIAGFQQIIARAHARGVRVYGATILPFGGSGYDSPDREAARQRVNAWIRTSRAFDAVVDLDSTMRDAQQATRLRGDVDGGDHLHPNEYGYRVMAGAFDRALFTSSSLRLAKLFSDGVVLQRGVRVHVWGWGDPKTTVNVRLADRSQVTTVGADGRWDVHLPARPAGGPYELVVSSGDQQLHVSNVMIGDVWVASGQSNMEFTLSAALNAKEAIAAANDSLIREFKVPISYSEHPEEELSGGSWSPADPQHVGNFSAVAYFFARQLRQSERVPIGIINTTWGGSAIETWLSTATQRLTEDAPARQMATERSRMDSVRNALVAKLGSVSDKDPGLVNGTPVWADPKLDDSGWQPIKVPALWETQGYDGMDGIGWYRTTFTLSALDAQTSRVLTLGQIDDDDITWVNGIEVGRTNGYNVYRNYLVPAGVLREGTNVLTVRVADYGGGGGIYGAPSNLLIRHPDVGGGLPLAGTWKFRVGELHMGMDGQRINKVPAVTFNRMVNPILPFPIKGVIWYQGESNANNVEQASAYRQQLPLLVRSWRQSWAPSGSSATFPFFWVQLPNFGNRDSVPPSQSSWATIRESMTSTLALPNTGQAIVIDVGDPGDIHPKDKETVGKRLALVARRVAYNESVESSGPTYRAMRVQGNRATIDFDHVGSGLTSRSPDGSVDGFAIAGADEHWVWAKARIDGNRVVVWSDAVAKPVAVRYAWMNDPEGALLFSKDGLPAAPFRTDRW